MSDYSITIDYSLDSDLAQIEAFGDEPFYIVDLYNCESKSTLERVAVRETEAADIDHIIARMVRRMPWGSIYTVDNADGETYELTKS